MKKSTKILAMIIICSIAVTPMTVTAAKADQQNIQPEQVPISQRRVNWSGSAYISDASYTNVTSSNNLFNDRPEVTNSAGNSGTLSFRIVNYKGEIVGSAKSCAVGSSVKMDEIPFNSGTYTLQAKAATGKAGNYSIKID